MEGQELKKILSEPMTLQPTHCWELAQEVLNKQTKHFKRNDLYYGSESLIVTYFSVLDNKTYTVTIKESEV